MSLGQESTASEQTAWAGALAVCPLPVEPLRSGDSCPACGAGRMDYDGLLNLRCDQCGYAQAGGCFT